MKDEENDERDLEWEAEVDDIPGMREYFDSLSPSPEDAARMDARFYRFLALHGDDERRAETRRLWRFAAAACLVFAVAGFGTGVGFAPGGPVRTRYAAWKAARGSAEFRVVRYSKDDLFPRAPLADPLR